MRRRLLYLAVIMSALGAARDASGGLVAYWNLEEGTGTTTAAVVGSPQADGRLMGATWIAADLAPIAGTKAALFFQSTSADRVETNYPGVLGQAARSVTAWIRAEPTQTNSAVMVGWGANATDQRYSFRVNKTAADGALNAIRLEIQGSRAVATTPVTDRQWHHVAVTHGTGARIGEVKFYVDGKPDAMTGTPATAVINTASTSVVLGNSGHNTATYGFDGALDEVRIYDHELTQAEIQQIMRGAPAGQASGPNPANKAVDVLRDTTLRWTAGAGTSTRDVYVGTTFADVNTASRAEAKSVLVSRGQTETSHDPAGVFAYGQTYYWRIDEVNKTPDNTIFKGEVWSFTVEPYGYPLQPVAATASSAQPGMGPEKTIDGSGLDNNDLHGTEPATMWLSAGGGPNWIQYEFDQVYKLSELQVWNSNQLIEAVLGFGAKSVTLECAIDGQTWTPVQGVPEFAKAPGAAGYAANTTVNLGGTLAKYVKLTINAGWGGMPTTGLSEVRFFYVPLQARGPQPATAATGIGLDATLDWRPGREAASHKVYFGTDANAVAQGTAPAKTLTDHSYTPDSLNLGTTYYWRVDEVNAVTYPGEVWSFTTQAYAIVDDFESYTDKPGEEIFSIWIDGFADNYKSSGSTVGLDTAKNGTFGETTIIHGGKQSMPLAYDNTKGPGLSEAVLTFDTPQDWTASGIRSLSLWFQGAAGNNGQLYVKINSTKVLYDGGAADLARPTWQVWNLDLSKAGKVNSVRSLTIGIEGAGAQGTLYIDDVRLYPKAPAYLTPVDPGPANLVGLWTLDGNANDTSGKGNNGTVNGTVQWVPGMVNQALQCNGTSTYVDCGTGASLNLTDAVTITAWIKMDFTAGDRKIAANQDGVAGGYKMGLYTNNMVEFEVRTAANAATLNRNSAGGTALQQGVWYHVAGVYSKGQFIRTYVFGNLDRELLTTAVLGSSAGTFKIGRGESATTYFWQGALDDVRVYNKVLSQEEIMWLAGQTKPVAKPL
jgi:hypothetical protein